MALMQGTQPGPKCWGNMRVGVGARWYLVVGGGSDISTEVEPARGVQKDNREGLVEVSWSWLWGERQRSQSGLGTYFQANNT